MVALPTSIYFYALTVLHLSLVSRVTPLPPGGLRTALFWPCILRAAIIQPHVLRTV